MLQIGVIGEAMVELSSGSTRGEYALAYGGDAINTVIYAARLGAKVTFLSAMADSILGEEMMSAWKSEGVDLSGVRLRSGGEPSLYLIRNDENGERNFHYWRSASPFRHWLSPGDYLNQLPDLLASCELILFSGIGLSMLPEENRFNLLTLLADYRRSGGRVAFDPNYRPVLWSSAAEARSWMDRAYRISDIALPSAEDENELLPFDDFQQRLDSIADLGVEEIVFKQGQAGCHVMAAGQVSAFPIASLIDAVDTTAAGDSFNAGYLVARLNGEQVDAAVRAGQSIAAKVVGQHGAIVSLD